MGDRRGQSGLDRLALFVLGVLAFLVVAPVALNAVGLDVRSAPAPIVGGEESPEPGELVVLSATGGAIDGDRSSIGTVEVVVTATGGPVDLSGLTVTWLNGSPQHLVPAAGGVGGADGVFRLERDGTGTLETDERAVLTFDPGTDDVDGLAEFGRRPLAGHNVTLLLGGAGGERIDLRLRVPERLPAGGSVSL